MKFMNAARAFGPAIFATGGGSTFTATTPSDWSSVISALTAQISVSTIVSVLTTLVVSGIGLVFLWWGVRKALRSLMAAFRKGKMSL